ncbi:MAG: MlaD family protein, partial [Terriglobales bacterium]
MAVAVAILVAVIFATTGQTSWFTPRIHIFTFVSDAGGMLPGANVNLEGVVIGNVTGIHLAEHPPDAKKPVEVAMSVAKGHERWLRADSTVVLGTAGPLGQTLVNISAGTLAAPPAAEGSVLKGEESTGINQLLVSSHDVVTNAAALEGQIAQLLKQIQEGNGSIGALIYSREL